MIAWVLVAMACSTPGPCTHGASIAAYATERQCDDALNSYDAKVLASRRMMCVQLDAGTMVILRSMR